MNVKELPYPQSYPQSLRALVVYSARERRKDEVEGAMSQGMKREEAERTASTVLQKVKASVHDFMTLPTILQSTKGSFLDNVWAHGPAKFARGGRFHEKRGVGGMKSTELRVTKICQTSIRHHITRRIFHTGVIDAILGLL